MTSLDPWDRALLDALEDPDGGSDYATVTLEEMAGRTGLSLPLLEALAREGLLLASRDGAEPSYDLADAEAVQAGLALVERGLPLGELLGLARRVHEAMAPVAADSVDLFARFVRDSVEARAGSAEDAARALVEAFRGMLPAAEQLVAHHFRTLLLAEARRRLR